MDDLGDSDRGIGKNRRVSDHTRWTVKSDGRESIPEGSYPHIRDLVSRGSPQVDVNTPIKTLLRLADISARQAENHLQLRRLDLAYVEYLTASNLVVDLIPRHKDAPSLNADRGELWRMNKSIIKSVNSQQENFEIVKHCIKENNARSGVTPAVPSNHRVDTPHAITKPTEMDIAPGSPTHNGEFDVSSSLSQRQRALISPRHKYDTSPLIRDVSPSGKPAVRPKPEALNSKYAPMRKQLHDEAYSRSSADALTDRFARLRSTSNKSLEVDVQSRSGYGPPWSVTLSEDSQTTHPARDSQQWTAQDRPAGPRQIPVSNGPPPPPKIPLSTQVTTSLPRPPSPTYSPAWNSPTPAGIIDPPRSTAENSKISNGFLNPKTRPGTSSAHCNVHNDNSSQNFRASTAYGVERQRRPPSVSLAMETSISAEKLYDYLRLFNVLLVDVRNREEFDQGHVFAQSILCIEPAGLHIGMSADELEERLILSPDAEQKLFRQRHLYDLVVYYDQSSTSTRHLRGPREQAEPPALRALFDAISEFSYERPLQRRPILLMGGIDAWADLVGMQALKTSDMAHFDGQPLRKSAQRSKERQASSSAYVSNPSKANIREFDPLEPEEQRAWLERARVEGASVAGGIVLTPTGSDRSERGDDQQVDSSPLYQNYEDFLRRFPEAPPSQQSMVFGPSSFNRSTTVRDGPVSTPDPPSRPPPAVPRRTYSGVSERVTPQSATVSRSSEASQPPLYTSNVNSGLRRTRLPRTGLINFSVTCYMNATIQCLSATLPLTAFFLDNSYRSVVQQNWKGSQGVLPELYANVLRELWKGDVEAIRPTSFRRFCTRLKKQWGDNYHQQDAKEFLDFLVDCLHEDLNTNWARTPLRQLTTKEELQRERMPMQLVSQKEYNRYSHRDSSIISRYFAGQHASRLRCTTCKNTSTTYEPFYSISVEIPRSGAGDIRQCLKSFCKEEMLSGEEVWKCPYCECEREATKQITITRAPQFLIIHFKRFSASKTESARKIHTPIDFPLNGLDIEPFMAAPMTSAIAQQAATAHDPSAVRSDYATTPPYRYDAYAVMRHLGSTVGSGHYVSLIKNGGSGFWRQFNDQAVTDIDPTNLSSGDKLQNGQAYLVFYARSNS
ncbi:MAG: ubiquitin-specific protease doa4 [Candelina mexicana]|nr:MAG: ubiquitin-specific protease doa4 [Candelina mexicana]